LGVIYNIERQYSPYIMANETIIEICAGSVESCIIAEQAGAQRVELCSVLSLGGVTPSYGMIAAARKAVEIDINVLIRPRQGDFIYSRHEMEIMMKDIELCADLKTNGVVFGALDKYGNIDKEFCRPLADLARSRSLSFTFHRAIDQSADIIRSVEEIIWLGADRILTSGGAPTAPEALSIIRKMVEVAQGRIVIMPGSGIDETNILEVINETRTGEVHLSASEQTDSSAVHRPPLSFTPEILGGDYTRKESSLQKAISAINKIRK